MMGYGGMGFGMGIFGWLIQLMLLIGLAWLVIYVVKSVVYRADHGGINPTSSRAKDIVAERYARGEISEEEYKRIRDNL